MSGNSRSSCLKTAPIVSAFVLAGGGTPGDLGAHRSIQVGELVLAHLQLVAVLELVRLDPAPVHVGAVERAEVVDVEAVAPAHQQGVVARDRHVVEEHLGLGAAPDRHALAATLNASPERPPPARITSVAPSWVTCSRSTGRSSPVSSTW